MKKDFEVLNIKCGGCATTVKKKLIDRFPDVTVDLDKDPRIVSATINHQEEEDYLIKSLHELGYPLKTAELDALTKKYLGVKSYAACMHGKLSNKISNL